MCRALGMWLRVEGSCGHRAGGERQCAQRARGIKITRAGYRRVVITPCGRGLLAPCASLCFPVSCPWPGSQVVGISIKPALSKVFLPKAVSAFRLQLFLESWAPQMGPLSNDPLWRVLGGARPGPTGKLSGWGIGFSFRQWVTPGFTLSAQLG